MLDKILVLLALTATAKLTDATYFYNSSRPLVIAHRGSSGHFPEHSIGSYTDAYLAGADFVELDLQITKDNVLIAQHDPTLNGTTNARIYSQMSSFAAREQEVLYVSDKVFYNDWLVNDFTLNELKMLNRR